MSLIPNIPPKLFTLSAVAIGYVLIDNNTPNEQNALGNWLMLVAQILCTNAYFLQVQEDREEESSSDNQMSDEDTIMMMQKMIDALTIEVENIKKSL